MISAIPSHVPNDLRAKLKSQIRFGNEKSLRHRLRRLINSLDPDTASVFCNDAKSFVEGIVATNYWTHNLTEKDLTVLEGERLVNACEQLHVFLLILFVKHLGIPEAVVRDRLNVPGTGGSGLAGYVQILVEVSCRSSESEGTRSGAL